VKQKFVVYEIGKVRHEALAAEDRGRSHGGVYIGDVTNDGRADKRAFQSIPTTDCIIICGLRVIRGFDRNIARLSFAQRR
jgi:hypothetical protein